jgi:hypothetical protein
VREPEPVDQECLLRPRRRGASAAALAIEQPVLRAPEPVAAATWGLFRFHLGVVGAPDVYPPPPRPAVDAKVAAAARGGGSRSARFEQVAAAVDRIGAGQLGERGAWGGGMDWGSRCSREAWACFGVGCCGVVSDGR